MNYQLYKDDSISSIEKKDNILLFQCRWSEIDFFLGERLPFVLFSILHTFTKEI